MFGECHAHIALNGTDYSEAVRLHKNGVDETAVRRTLETYRSHGISFIREGGDAWGVSEYAMRIAPEYGIDYRTPVFAIHKQGRYGAIVGRSYETLKEYAALVKEAAEHGADFIKIMTTGIMDFREYGKVIAGDPINPGELREMVHIAHESGFAVMSHTNGRDAVLQAIEAEVDSIEHGNFIDDACIRAFATVKTAFLPTATVARNLSLCPPDTTDPSVLTEIWEHSKKTIRKAYETGVILAIGSDAGAVGVGHGQGAEDEYACFRESVPDQDGLLVRLQDGEAFIKKTFHRH